MLETKEISYAKSVKRYYYQHFRFDSFHHEGKASKMDVWPEGCLVLQGVQGCGKQPVMVNI